MSFSPLKGIRVLDLTSVVVGPAATWRLGQYGADVIKVESPSGDLMRELGGASPTGQHSGTFLHLNRGKRNICIDLKNPNSKKVMDRLIDTSDVIVANMRPQALSRLGLDAKTIQARHPDKIYCLMTGYGSGGPYAGYPTYDSVVQGVSGIAGLSGARGSEPKYVPMVICDHVVGEIAASSILGAILERQATGRGSFVEVPMFETMAAFVLQEHLAQESFSPAVGPVGDQRLLNPHNNPVQTKDGYMSFTVNTDKQVRAFLEATDRVDLLEDKRFLSVATRAENVSDWFEVRGAPLTNKTTIEWLEILRNVDVAVMPCHTLESLQDDPHLQAVNLINFESHPTEGKTAVIRSSILVNGESTPTMSPSAPKGWDSLAILENIGFCQYEIEELIEDGSVFIYEKKVKEI